MQGFFGNFFEVRRKEGRVPRAPTLRLGILTCRSPSAAEPSFQSFPQAGPLASRTISLPFNELQKVLDNYVPLW